MACSRPGWYSTAGTSLGGVAARGTDSTLPQMRHTDLGGAWGRRVENTAVVTQDPRFGGGALTQISAFVAASNTMGRPLWLYYGLRPPLRGASPLGEVPATTTKSRLARIDAVGVRRTRAVSRARSAGTAHSGSSRRSRSTGCPPSARVDHTRVGSGRRSGRNSAADGRASIAYIARQSVRTVASCSSGNGMCFAMRRS